VAVSNVRIGNAGRALLLVTGSFSLDTSSGEWANVVIAAYRDGAVYPNFEWDATLVSLGNGVTATSAGGSITGTVGGAKLAGGDTPLTPGTYEFRAYATWVNGTSPTVSFVNVTVLPY
jgi:hypothetical protein